MSLVALVVVSLATAKPDPDEPLHVAEAVRSMRLRHAVVTSVNRDDLPDQGSGQFVETIEKIRALNPARITSYNVCYTKLLRME